MASATELLRLVIDADSKGAMAQFEAIGASADKNLGKTDDKLRKVGAGLTTFGAGLATAGAAAGAGLFKLAMMSEDAAMQSRKLANSVANSEHVFRANGAALEEQAKALQQVTAADADAVIGAQSLLVQFGNTESQVQTLTPLMVDLSRKMGVDLDQAAKAIGKSADGSAGALKKMGITVDEAKFKVDPFAATVEALRGTVGGFAEQEGKTFSGQIETLKNNLGDLGEAVGGGAAGVLSGITDKLGDMAHYLGEVNPELGNTVGKIGAIGSIAAVSVGGLSVLAGQALKMRDVFTVVGEDGARSLTKVGAAARGVSIAAGVIAGVWALDAGLKAVTTSSSDLAANLDRLRAAGSGAEVFSQLVERTKELDGAWDDVQDAFVDGHGQMVKIGNDANAVEVDVHNLAAAFDDMANAGEFEQLGAALDYLSTRDVSLVGRDPRALDTFNAAIATARERVDAHTAAMEASTVVTGETADAYAELGVTIDEAASAYEAYSSAVLGSVNSMVGMTEAAGNLQDAQRKVAETTAEVARLEAEGKVGTEEYAKAVEAQRDANWDAAKSAIKQQEAVQQLSADLESGKISTDAATAAVRDLAASGAITTDQANILSFAIAGASAKADELGQKNPRPTIGADASGFWGTAWGIERWQPTDKTVQIRAVAVGVDAVMAAIQHIQAASISVTRRLGGRAAGGPVSAGQAYIVGERGEELFVPGESGTIVPNHQLGAGRVGGSVTHVHFHGPVARDSEGWVLDVLARANRSGSAAIAGVR